MDAAHPRKIGLKDILFMPVGCFLTLSPLALLGVLALIVLAGGYLYFNVNVDLLGAGAPPFAELQISPDFRRIDRTDGSYLTISFELPYDSTFNGLVRHISPIRLGQFPVLTHDVLVTSGDFADPAKVKTSVFNHHFTWSSAANYPGGTINLLHTVPASQEIYRQLMAMHNGDTVRVIGREILRIDAFSSQGQSQGWWQDTGCNTLVVTSIQVLPEP